MVLIVAFYEKKKYYNFKVSYPDRDNKWKLQKIFFGIEPK